MFTKHLDTLKLLALENEIVPKGWVLQSKGDLCSKCEHPLLCHDDFCSACGTEVKPSEPLS